MKELIALMVLLPFTGGCSPAGQKPVCRHTSALAAVVAQDTCRGEACTQICYGKIGETRHAQARVFRDGRWRWLHVEEGYVLTGLSVLEGEKDPGFRVKRCIPAANYIFTRFFMREVEK